MNTERDNNQKKLHEPVSVSIAGLLIAGAGLVALVGLSFVMMWFLAEALTKGGEPAKDITDSEPKPERGVALVANQRAQRIRSEQEQKAQLQGYRWADHQESVARIPLQRAVELVAERYQREDSE